MELHEYIQSFVPPKREQCVYIAQAILFAMISPEFKTLYGTIGVLHLESVLKDATETEYK